MAGYGYASDHVCKPVIIDAYGRKHPIVSYGLSNRETCVVETETIVQQQQARSPFVNEYKHNSYTKFEPLKDYGRGEDQWRRSSSPPVHGHGRPQKVDEFLTKVQTEASNPKSFGLLSPSVWHRPSTPPGQQGNRYELGNTGYGNYKPGGNTIQNGDYDNYNRNNNNRMEPSMNTSDGWARPSHAGWGAPPDTSLSRPTNDIRTAVEYLKEAVSPNSVAVNPLSRMTVPITTGPKGNQDDGQTFDSREVVRPNSVAANPPSRMTGPKRDQDYGRTFDNREAVRPNSVTANPLSRMTGPKQDQDYGQTFDNREAVRPYSVAANPLSRMTGPKRDQDYGQTFDNKEAVRPNSVEANPLPRMIAPMTTEPKQYPDYGDTIDSREAARRYGNFNSSSVPEERYIGTIDSREAARKYKGTLV